MFASPWKTCPQSSATAGEPVRHPEPLQQLERQPQRQAHHPEEVTADPLDQRRALALDRVGAGLVERLPGGDVGGDLGVRKRSECHVGHVERVLHPPIQRHRHGRYYLMLPPFELPQHLGRFLGFAGFPKIVPRSTTVVSAASTTAPRSRRATVVAFSRASRVTYPSACSAGPRLSSTSGGTTRNSSPIISSSWRRRGDPLARTITSRGSALRVRHSRAPPPSSPRTLPWRPARRSLLPAPA